MFFNLFSIIVFQCILIFVAIKSVINRKIYKRFRMIKKKKERVKKDISEIEKLKKCVLLNKLLLFWSINISILTKYFHEIYLFIKNTFTKDYSENFLIFPSFFFFYSVWSMFLVIFNWITLLQTDCIAIKCINNLLQRGIRKNESFGEHGKNSINVPPMMYHWGVELDAYR